MRRTLESRDRVTDPFDGPEALDLYTVDRDLDAEFQLEVGEQLYERKRVEQPGFEQVGAGRDLDMEALDKDAFYAS